MGLVGGIGRTLSFPLLLLNLIFAIIILGLAGRLLDREISGVPAGSGPLSGFQGNGATFYLILFSLLAALVAIASYLSGLHHLRIFHKHSGSGAQSAAWIAWLLLVIAFCLAWKEIRLGHRGVKLRALEAFVIMLTITHFIYTVLFHLGHKYDDNNGTAHTGKPLNPNSTPQAASAV